MRNMKILMIIELFPPHFSGKAKFIVRLSKELMSRGYEITILTAGVRGILKREDMDGLRIIREGGYFKRINRIFFLLCALRYLIFNGQKFDVYHIHGDPDIAIFARVLAKIFRKKTVTETSLLGADDPMSIRNRKTGFIRFPAFLLSNAFVSLSYPITEAFKTAEIDLTKVYLMPRLVDGNIFKPVGEKEKMRIRERLNLPLHKFIIVTVGQVGYRKGYDVLVGAFKTVKEHCPEVFLLAIGPNKNLSADEHFYSDLLKFIDSNNLSENIRFTGEVNNVQDYLQASDIFVFPSRKEGFANAIIEAMSVGLPCIVSELDGTSRNDIFTLEYSGVVMPDPIPSEYAQAILDFIGNKTSRVKYGERAREVVKNRFSIDKIAKNYISMYSSIISD